ncbi:MAG: hypothetical protein A2138_24560 [Deltaproteobacteria bacterium RBG_16_71_12]|nr:MAG: hypothetical protein A2138_24560 [Deltaproteobacteria bacterium RBG_16_71_12]
MRSPLPRPSASAALALCAVAALLVFAPARAGESDPFWEWRRPVRDSTAALNATLEDGFERGLAEVNRSPYAASMACADVVEGMTAPLRGFEFLFFVGGIRGRYIDARPASNTEDAERARTAGLFRYVPPFNVGLKAPLRPIVRGGDVRFALDKVGHFLAEGVAGYRVLVAERARGADERAAVRAALMNGVHQENGIYGRYITGVFSFADLEANARGLRWVRDLCDGPRPGLSFADGRWRTAAPFDLRSYVTPCMDEAWLPNGYFDGLWDEVRRGVRASCGLRRRPDVVARFAAYAQRRCDADLAPLIAELAASGAIPDPRRFTMDEACR